MLSGFPNWLFYFYYYKNQLISCHLVLFSQKKSLKCVIAKNLSRIYQVADGVSVFCFTEITISVLIFLHVHFARLFIFNFLSIHHPSTQTSWQTVFKHSNHNHRQWYRKKHFSQLTNKRGKWSQVELCVHFRIITGIHHTPT